MNWKGHELETIGDLMTHGIDACEAREEAFGAGQKLGEAL